eukprot:10591072-Alexandrium_andersonii.AAC.1
MRLVPGAPAIFTGSRRVRAAWTGALGSRASGDLLRAGPECESVLALENRLPPTARRSGVPGGAPNRRR